MPVMYTYNSPVDKLRSTTYKTPLHVSFATELANKTWIYTKSQHFKAWASPAHVSSIDAICAPQFTFQDTLLRHPTQPHPTPTPVLLTVVGLVTSWYHSISSCWQVMLIRNEFKSYKTLKSTKNHPPRRKPSQKYDLIRFNHQELICRWRLDQVQKLA